MLSAGVVSSGASSSNNHIKDMLKMEHCSLFSFPVIHSCSSKLHPTLRWYYKEPLCVIVWQCRSELLNKRLCWRCCFSRQWLRRGRGFLPILPACDWPNLQNFPPFFILTSFFFFSFFAKLTSLLVLRLHVSCNLFSSGSRWHHELRVRWTQRRYVNLLPISSYTEHQAA